MQPVSSILVALAWDRDSAGALGRAAMLARRFGARVDLFQCEAERAYALHHQYDPGSTNVIRDTFLAESRGGIERQWRSLDVNDVAVSVDAVCESPLYDAIKRKVERSGPGLVIRGIGGRECAFSVADSDLLRTCPAPLLLTRGKVWRRKPTIAAAVDLSGAESPNLTYAILIAAADMAEHCGAELQVLYAQRSGAPTAEESRARLTACVVAAKVQPAQLHVITGEPATVIPQFAARQGYEMLVLGALTHRKSTTALVGTLTGRLVETVDCDLLLVKAS
jgi:universal stress protein E